MAESADESKLHFLDYWRVIRVRMPLIILTFLVVVITVSILTYFMARQYASTVTLEVREQDKEVHIFQNEAGHVDPRFLTTQFQIIQQKEVLYPVIASLNLVQKWQSDYHTRTPDDAYHVLKSKMNIQEVRNTELIQITIYDTDAAEAADLANTIALEYQKKRIQEEDGYVSRSLAQLENEITQQRKKVVDLHEQATKIRVESGVVDLSPESEENPQQSIDKLLSVIEEQVSNERMKEETTKVKAEKIAQLTDDELMRSATTLDIQDPTIREVLPQYQAATVEEARLLNNGLGPNHPAVKSLRAKMKEYQQQLKDQIASLRKALKTNLETEQSSLASLEQKLVEARKGQESSKTDSQAYATAKGTYIQAKKILEAADARYHTEAMQINIPHYPVTIWEKAEPAATPAKPNVPLQMAVGVLFGAIMGIGLAFFIEYLDTSVKTMEDVETFLAVPVLAIIPKNITLLINESPDHPDAEAYRILRTNVEFNRKSPDANTLTIISGGAGEGKSTTLNNLAYTFARGGYNTLVVDADLRRPTQHKLFNIGNDVGLTNYLTTDMPLEEVILSTTVENLYILPSGKLPLDAVGILNSQRMVEMINELKSRFDMVFFDSPPILGVSDASVLASAVDLAIIVVQHRRFPRAMLLRVKQSILNVGGTILGVVLNNVDVRHDHHYEYYTSYYNYYQTPRKDGGKAAKNKGKAKDAESKKGGLEKGEY